MNVGMRKRVLLGYPEWHNNPLRLTAWQIKHPEEVFDDFFTSYTLPDARICLKEWLNDALVGEDMNALDTIALYDDIEKLVEAAWIILQQNNAGAGFEDIDEEEDEQSPAITENPEPIHFQKPPLLTDIAGKYPIRCLAKIFERFHTDEIFNLLQLWLETALRNEQSTYRQPLQRAGLFAFCREFHLLTEALSILCEIGKPSEIGEWLEQPNEKLKKYQHLLRISKEQTTDPMVRIESFCSRFTLHYVRAELWDLLESVITSEPLIILDSSHKILDGSNKRPGQKEHHLSHYQCLLCLAETAYALNRNFKNLAKT